MVWLRPTDIVVVTGGSHGLGASILKEFARQGCQTVSLDIVSPLPVTSPEMDEVVSPPQDVPTNSSVTVNPVNVDSASEEPHDEGSPAISGSINDHPESPLEVPNGEVSASEVSTGEVSNDVDSSAEVSTSSSSKRSSTVEENSQEEDDKEDNLNPTLTIKCDVRSVEDLKHARELIFETFKRYPSVIVLNAGVRSELNSIADSTYEDLQETIDINLIGVLKCMRTFLPDIIANERGFIITISSALGIVVPKGLGSYGASKAGLIGIHEALDQETSDYKDVKAMLVCPGQLDTKMFSDVKTPSEYLAPVVSPDKLAAKIVKRVKKAKFSTVYYPAYVRYLPLMNSMPTCWSRLARKISGIDKVYDDAVNERANLMRIDEESLSDTTDVDISKAESEMLENCSSGQVPNINSCHTKTAPSFTKLAHPDQRPYDTLPANAFSDSDVTIHDLQKLAIQLATPKIISN